MHSTVAESPPQVARTRFLSPGVVLLCGTLALLWFILCRDLSLEWSSNAQYSYGWFVPFFAAFLFWLRWEEWPRAGDQRSDARGQKTDRAGDTRTSQPTSVLWLLSSVILLALLFPVRLFEVANPDWRPLSWTHGLIVVGFSLLVIGYWGGKAAVRHFAFPVCFILVAVPWLTPIEAPLVQWLMRIVAAVATETLTLFGIPAQLEGSLIRVHSGVVGVNEACSGVRSLQTSLMIGLLFGELRRLTIARRALLVAAALTIALVANFGRAFFLVWIAATRNLAAVEHWHDLAGYAIVAAVFLGTLAVAGKLEIRKAKVENGKRTKAPTLQPAISGPVFPPSTFYFLLFTFCYLLLVEAGVAAWYRAHERLLVPGRQWTVQWPETVPGFRDLLIDERTRELLRFDAGREASWPATQFVRPDEAGAEFTSPADRTAMAFLFFFRWEPGTATILRARAHHPDICLPYVGWRQVGEPDSRSYAVTADFSLPFQHFSFTHEQGGGRPLYAETFFCLREDLVRAGPEGEKQAPFSSWTRNERWEVVREGLRNPGQQVMEFVLTTRHALSQDEVESGFGRLLPKLVTLKADN